MRDHHFEQCGWNPGEERTDLLDLRGRAPPAFPAIRPDAVILDIGLPKLNGYDVARRIRNQPWGTQVLLVALTGWGQEEDTRQSTEAGIDHHLTKPIEPTVLRGLFARVRSPPGEPK